MGAQTRFGYRPALDGVRAVSIALVLAFHAGAPWMAGGYLGVSVFFTLSGFLITSLLLRERGAEGRIDVRAFYVRRLRRLLPASLVCLVGIAVLAAAGVVAAREDLRAGVLGAVLQVANWEQLLGDHSYADLFLAPSPVDHFWSLAIEEQFYWVWPLVIAGLTSIAPRRVARALVIAFVVLGASAFVTARTLGGDAAYFASWARFAEILAGAALAALLAGRPRPAWTARLAAPCLLGIVALAVVTPAGRGWAYEGGLPLFAVLSAGLILGVQGDGIVTRLLAREPVPWIGRISYGLYLFHWPVFTILDDASVLEKLAITSAIAVASYYLVERPIRTGQWIASPVAFVRGAAVAVVAAVGAIAVLVPVVERAERTTEPVVIAASAPDSSPPETTAIASVVEPGPATVAPETTTVTPTSSTIPPPRVVALFGDSIADWLLRDAAASFARPDATVVDVAIEGCDGAVRIPEARGRAGEILRLPDDCKEWTASYPAAVENPALPVDVAVLVLGYAPMVERRVGDRWIGPCDDLDWYLDDLGARVAYLRSHVDEVMLALPSWGGDKASFLSSDDHLVRAGCIRGAMRSFAAEHAVATVDLAELLCPAGPDGECSDLREADGTHVDPDDAPYVLEWLLDRVLGRA